MHKLLQNADEDTMPKLTVYQIPVCPFTQRLAILMQLKGLAGRLAFHVVDIARPRRAWLLEKSRRPGSCSFSCRLPQSR